MNVKLYPTMTCPECGKTFDIGYQYCPYCKEEESE
jgi:predicted amidophosphoribosyltransferase